MDIRHIQNSVLQKDMQDVFHMREESLKMH